MRRPTVVLALRNMLLLCGFSFGLLLVSSAMQVAHAQNNQRLDATGIQLQQFRPWMDPEGLFQNESGAGLGQWNFKVGLFLNYAKDPLILRVIRSDRPLSPERIDIMQHQFAADVVAGIGFLNWLDLEVSIPITFYQLGTIPSNGAITSNLHNRNMEGAYFSDIRIALKFQALREKKHWLNMAIKLYLGVPSGNADSFNGEGDVSFGAGLLLNKKFSIVNVAFNLGYRYLPRTQFVNLVISHELTYGLGLGVEAIKKRLDIIGEIAGGTQLVEGVSENAAPFEFLVGARVYPLRNSKNLALSLGMGFPILPGYGTPQFRVFLGITYARRVFDADKDGVDDENDKCPKTPGPKENNGCPWPDTDGDGLTDNVDKCPKVPGPKENKGCPYGDKDNDGLKDNEDDCPNRPGPIANKGCPWPDTDNDGIDDKSDKCPKRKGPKKYQGCPDTDGDGINDLIDLCPNDAGLKKYQGCPDFDGDGFHDGEDKCPKQWGPRENLPKGHKKGCPLIKVDLTKRKIEILDKIYFEFNRWRIKPRSYTLLKNVVRILKNYPQMRVLIEGHTDKVGSYKYNMWLSRRRAQSVRNFLVKNGIKRNRLRYRGFGFTKPLTTNRTQAGRDKNRRVEFTILNKPGDLKIKKTDRDQPKY
ncbi:MAG: hypothetical protein EP343_10655 [Deltaproteobacteria bacterium]|nr:MAG: hypothetical protein EP343_10655 [Deltaproteobacteria bacterium]